MEHMDGGETAAQSWLLVISISAFCSETPGFCLETPSFPQLRIFSFFQLNPQVLLGKFPQPLQSSCSAGKERLLVVQSSSQGMDFMKEAPALWEAGQP